MSVLISLKHKLCQNFIFKKIKTPLRTVWEGKKNQFNMKRDVSSALQLSKM